MQLFFRKDVIFMPKAKYQKEKRSDGKVFYYTYEKTGIIKPNGIPEYKKLRAKTIAKLDEKVKKFQTDAAFGIEHTDLTVDDWKRQWFQSYKSACRPSTKAFYESLYDTHIKPSIGQLRLNMVKEHACQKILNELSETHSEKTVASVRSILFSLFDKAQANHYIITNPAQRLKARGKPQKKRRELTVNERKKYYNETDRYKMLVSNTTDNEWLHEIKNKSNAIILLEGVSMYLSNEQLTKLIKDLSDSFNKISLLMDCYTIFAAKMSKYKNPVKDVGVNKVYGIDDPTTLETDNFKYIKEHDMIPKEYLNNLRFEYAKKLLTESELTVQEVCDSCGFDDYPNFIRRFKNRFNMSPMQYKKAFFENETNNKNNDQSQKIEPQKSENIQKIF